MSPLDHLVDVAETAYWAERRTQPAPHDAADEHHQTREALEGVVMSLLGQMDVPDPGGPLDVDDCLRRGHDWRVRAQQLDDLGLPSLARVHRHHAGAWYRAAGRAAEAPCRAAILAEDAAPC